MKKVMRKAKKAKRKARRANSKGNQRLREPLAPLEQSDDQEIVSICQEACCSARQCVDSCISDCLANRSNGLAD